MEFAHQNLDTLLKELSKFAYSYILTNLKICISREYQQRRRSKAKTFF